MHKKVKIKPMFFIVIFTLLLLCVGGLLLFLSSPVNSKDKKDIEIEVKSGESVSKIGRNLKSNNLIRSELLFKIYVKIYKVKSLKASTYKLNRSMRLREIISSLENGSNYNPDMIKLTFKEGERITSYAKVIADNTNNSYDDVINTIKNKDYLKELISKYWFLTDEILNEQIYYPLEGYLMPETYHFDNKDVTVKEIINRMLDETEKNIEFAKFLDSCNSVFIHARRGDSLQANSYCYKYGYFQRAVRYIKKHIDHPVFVFFTNTGSIEWCKENSRIFGLDYSKDQVYFVDWNIGEDSFRDMQLMTHCKHGIITNSSFGWWGAYLIQNPNKITISPSLEINTTHHF